METSRQLIAIVDDEESVRRALQRLLVSAGFRAQAFASGAEFLESLSTSRPACIVLDLHMPAMSGFEVQQQLRGEKIPIIVITGHDADESQQRVLNAGAVAYLRKPVDDQTLICAISTAIAARTDGDTDIG